MSSGAATPGSDDTDVALGTVLSASAAAGDDSQPGGKDAAAGFDRDDRSDRSDRIDRAWRVLGTVLDPEVPALSIRDLGIVRDVIDEPAAGLHIVLTPTYSGCPATEAIERDVLAAISAAGLGPARVSLRRAPAWTTDWISPEGRAKLLAYGIAPPAPVAEGGDVPIRFVRRASPAATIACPQCGSANTERLSAFGSTACKALYRCLACREPFEHFKPI